MRPEDDPPPDGGGVPPEHSNSSEEENSGTILMDATCAPADIRYPTDLNLVNEARELTETVIDKLRGALRFLLNAIRRNLEFIAKLRDRCGNIPQIIAE